MNNKIFKEQTPLSRLISGHLPCPKMLPDLSGCRRALKKGEVLKHFGFTLVEMLVVISIIGILSAVLAGGYINSQKNSKDAARKLNLKSISDALNSYYADYGRYPLATGTTGINSLIDNQGEFAVDGNIYMKKMPKEDIIGGRSGIRYEVSPSAKSFRLYINLENEEDKSCQKDSLGEIENNLNGYTIISGCIYLLTSSNASATGTLP